MTPISPARLCACRLLFRWEKEDAYVDILFREAMEESDLSPRDKALAAFLLYGTVENLMYIDYLLAQTSTVRLKKIHPRVLCVLRVSVFQILFGKKLPLHAILNDAVSMVGKINPKAKGFCNAVLRKLSVYRDCEPVIEAEAEEERLSIRYSHPLPLVKLYRETMDLEECEAMLAWNNGTPPTEIRWNSLLGSKEALNESLASAGVTPEWDPDLPMCATLPGQVNVEEMEAFQKGMFTVQSRSSVLDVLAADPKPGDFVVDTCGAPGGKSFLAAMLMKNKGMIVTRDIYSGRVDAIREGIKRLGVKIMVPEVHDASVEDKVLSKKADLVICDVPCSGLGVISKKPDIKYKSMDGIEGLPALQKSILRAASGMVKPGGRLVYSTCTTNKHENEEVVEAFLAENPEFCREDAKLPAKYATKNGERLLLPTRDGMDGFYFCRMKRKQA
ncbi:MAG: 16S rRNA (cytosine(967)-C(5))-methyltransferase RsmB [Clostridia bacterium]|nr:16S rRNA (cytosine(967)-C(5))-methyltransferase RsmB [Clostridia bacterium]